MKKKCRYLGVSLVETLSVVVILTILTAIIYPVYGRSILQAKAKLAPHNLRQIWMSMILYQQDEGGEPGAYQSWSGENLPSLSAGHDLIRKFATEDKQSTCGKPINMFRGGGPGVAIVYLNDSFDSDSLLRKYKEKTMAFADANCNDASVDVKSQFQMKRVIGINLEGQLLDKSSDRWQFWQHYFWE